MKIYHFILFLLCGSPIFYWGGGLDPGTRGAVKIIIKASGANKKILTFNNFIDLLNGKDVKTSRIAFEVDWKTLTINIVKVPLTLQGLETQPVRILNPILNGEEVAISLLRTYPIVIYSPKCYFFVP